MTIASQIYKVLNDVALLTAALGRRSSVGAGSASACTPPHWCALQGNAGADAAVAFGNTVVLAKIRL
jgi:hypothetical protein